MYALGYCQPFPKADFKYVDGFPVFPRATGFIAVQQKINLEKIEKSRVFNWIVNKGLPDGLEIL